MDLWSVEGPFPQQLLLRYISVLHMVHMVCIRMLNFSLIVCIITMDPAGLCWHDRSKMTKRYPRYVSQFVNLSLSTCCVLKLPTHSRHLQARPQVTQGSPIHFFRHKVFLLSDVWCFLNRFFLRVLPGCPCGPHGRMWETCCALASEKFSSSTLRTAWLDVQQSGVSGPVPMASHRILVISQYLYPYGSMVVAPELPLPLWLSL